MRRWCREWLGVPFENIRFIQGDTNEVPIGRGTYGSRSMMVGGNALKRAADQIVEKAKPMAARMLEAAASDLEFKDGKFTVVGTDKSIELPNVAKAFYAPMFLPNDVGVGLEAAGTFAAEPPCYPNGCHTCEVEIDPQTGVVEVVRYTAVDDVGKVMNHLLAEGQVHGGVAQGLGQALMENIVYDNSGQLLSGSFMDYAMPRADDIPQSRIRDRGNSLDHQSARRQGLRRGRRDRRAAGDHGGVARCAQTVRHRGVRHAGDAGARVAGAAQGECEGGVERSRAFTFLRLARIPSAP